MIKSAAPSPIAFIILCLLTGCFKNESYEQRGEPKAPESFEVTSIVSGPEQLTLSWQPSAGAAAYLVRRGTGSGNYTHTFGPITETSYFDSGLSSGSKYFYQVTATSGGKSTAAPEVSATVLPGSFVVSSAFAREGSVDLSWSPSLGAKGYTVRRGTSAGTYPTIVNATATSPFTDDGLTNGTTYFYVVEAVNEGGRKTSNEVSATPQIWTKEMGAASSLTQGLSVAADAGGNIFVLGITDANLDATATGAGTFISKFNAAGVKSWTRQLTATGFSARPWGTAIIVDPAGDVIITGNTTGPTVGNAQTGVNDYFVAKYSSSGVLQWVKQGGVGGKDVFANALGTDSAGNIYVTGYTNGGLEGNTLTGFVDLFVLKYTSTGIRAWTKQFGKAGTDLRGFAIALDASDQIYLAGSAWADYDGQTVTGIGDALTMKLDNAGSRLWTRLQGVSGKVAQARAIAIDGEGNVIVGSNIDPNALWQSPSPLVTKYGSDGATLFSSTSDDGSVWLGSVAVDSSNAIYLGTTNLGGNPGRPQLTKLSSNGATVWSKSFHTAGSYQTAQGVVTTADLVYVVGTTGTVGADGNALLGNADAFLFKFNSTGQKY